MSKTTIAFVPGFSEGPAVFSSVTSVLESQYQYQTRIVPLVSTGTAQPNHEIFTGDARYVREAVEDLVNQGKELFSVAHSAGAAVASQAVEGLALAERKDRVRRWD